MSSEQSNTRTRILQANLDLLEDHPKTLPRMSDIAKAAGVSRQALYLHFDSRTDLLIETTRYQDRQLDVESMLAPSRAAQTGKDRLDAFVTAWANYIPRIWNVARALLSLSETEPEVKAAIDQRLSDVREGLEAAVKALKRDGDVPAGLDTTLATDLLSMMLSFRTYESLRIDHGWTQERYVETMQAFAQAVFLGGTVPLNVALSLPLDAAAKAP